MTGRRWCDGCRKVTPHERHPRFPTTSVCEHCGHGVVDRQRDMPPVAQFPTHMELSQPEDDR